MRWMSLLGAVLVVTACKTTPDPGPDPMTEAAVSMEQRTITLEPDMMQYDEAAGTVRFSPGSNVRSAQYTHYTLDLASLEAVLGGRPTEPVSVVVALSGPNQRTEIPANPNVQQPMGGFQITEWTGKVVAKAP